MWPLGEKEREVPLQLAQGIRRGEERIVASSPNEENWSAEQYDEDVDKDY